MVILIIPMLTSYVSSICANSDTAWKVLLLNPLHLHQPLMLMLSAVVDVYTRELPSSNHAAVQVYGSARAHEFANLHYANGLGSVNTETIYNGISSHQHMIFGKLLINHRTADNYVWWWTKNWFDRQWNTFMIPPNQIINDKEVTGNEDDVNANTTEIQCPTDPMDAADLPNATWPLNCLLQSDINNPLDCSYVGMPFDEWVQIHYGLCTLS